MATSAVELDVDGRAVRLSSPEKVYFTELGITKLDVANYVLAVGPQMLAGLMHRPTTMERWPGGVHPGMVLSTRGGPGGDAFFQKRTPKGTPEWVQRAQITFPSGRTAETVAPADVATLVWMVNLGTLRFHAWPVRASAPDVVDVLRLDLDPQPGTDFKDAVTAALELRSVLADCGLAAWCKTSGGRGVHVYAPITGDDFINVRHAGIAIGRELARRRPDLVTVAWWKEERGERVFLDFNQLARDRLMASAYSIRPVPEARVSMPLTWEALGDADPDRYTVETAPRILAEVGDPWHEMETATPGSIETALGWYDRDAANGEGEMPYPPEYPKMPGEPPRVQPSRARTAD